MADRIQLRRDTKLRWEQLNPILLEGEEGYVLDNPNLYKLGDGIHAWNDLPYRGYNGTIINENLGSDERAVVSEAMTSKLTTEINVSILYPTGSSEGTNLYDINTAITKLPDSVKRKGIKVSFLNSNADYEVWQFVGDDIANIESWEQCGPPVRGHIITTDNFILAFTDEHDNVVFGIDNQGRMVAPKGMSDEAREEFRKLNNWQDKQDDRLLAIEQGLWPLEVTYSLDKSAVEVSKESVITANVRVVRKGEDVTDRANITINGSTERQFNVTPDAIGALTYNLTVEYDGLSFTDSKSVVVTYPSYFGVVDSSFITTPENVAMLNSMVLPTNKYKATVSLAYQKVIYAYPVSKGVLTSITDENGYELINSYTRSVISIEGVDYYCYILTNPITITNGVQNYGN